MSFAGEVRLAEGSFDVSSQHYTSNKNTNYNNNNNNNNSSL